MRQQRQLIQGFSLYSSISVYLYRWVKKDVTALSLRNKGYWWIRVEYLM